jgi:hypothetical protein
MFDNADLLTKRTTSAIPVSIGTSLALESIFDGSQQPYDPARVIPNKVNVQNYQEIWININTLFRNITGAVEPEIALSASAQDYRDVILQEMDVINNLFQVEGNGTCRPRYYHITYAKLKKKTDQRIKFREDNTPSQKFYIRKIEEAIKLLMAATDQIVQFDSEINSPGHAKLSALILTHYPLDLLSAENFYRLDLIESHTGILKTKKDWNTKLYPVPDRNMKILPYLKRFVLLFGDKVQIHPSDIRIRRQVLDIAIAKQWTPMTTESKVMQDLQLHLKEPLVYAFINNLR